MKKFKNDYGRYAIFHLPDVEECAFERITNSYTYRSRNNAIQEEENVWRELEELLKIKIHSVSNEKPRRQLIEILYWVEKRDIYSAALLTSLIWEQMEKEVTETSYSDKITGYVGYLRCSSQ